MFLSPATRAGRRRPNPSNMARGPSTTFASAATVDLGASPTQMVTITGTTTITSFGGGRMLRRLVKFTGILTLTYNATSLVLPTAANLTTTAGDIAEVVSDQAGNWTVIDYSRADGSPLALKGFGPFTSLASAGTTDLSTVSTVGVNITGTTTITSFGTGANLLRVGKFAGALTLTHNATSLICPNAGNITTAAGDTFIALSDASGNWTIVLYERTGASITPGAPDVIVEDQETANTQAGTSASGSFQTRPLNTLVRNVNSIASLASNQVTLPAGTYYLQASAPSYMGNTGGVAKIDIFNVTDSAVAVVGNNEFCTTNALRNFVTGVVTITSSKAFAVRVRVQTGQASDGWGVATNMGETEVYARFEAWKIG